MLILLSPAKSLDFETPVSVSGTTQPQFVKQAAALVKVLEKQSAAELSELMSLSDSLAQQNAQRFRAWKPAHDEAVAKPAAFAFQGDVYQGWDIATLPARVVRRCQQHVRILSGLYGVLRPLDLIQPYRLEMGTKLLTDAGKDLYQFWGDTIRDCIEGDLSQLKANTLINLASAEYARAARLRSIDASIVSPVFKEFKGGQYKMISFFAKRARGLMTRYLMLNSITDVDGLLGFDLDGYSYNAEMSTALEPTFTRKAVS